MTTATNQTTVTTEHPLIAAILQKSADVSEIEERHQLEISEAKSEMGLLVRRISEISDIVERLQVIRFCYENRICPAKMLAWALFGDKNKGWHLRYAIRPLTRPCTTCGTPVATDRQNFEHSEILCQRCDQQASESVMRSMEEINRKRSLRQRRKAELAFKASNLLTEDEILELADLVIDDLRFATSDQAAEEDE